MLINDAIVDPADMIVPEVRFADSYEGSRTPNRIRFCGRYGDGYSADFLYHRGTGVVVRKEEDGLWRASYNGRPSIWNGWVRETRPYMGTGLSLSCSCPRVKLTQGFRTRREAALAGLAVVRKEEALCRNSERVDRNRIRNKAVLTKDGWLYS